MDNALWQALDVIREGGMAKMRLGPPDDRSAPHCAVGALECVGAYKYDQIVLLSKISKEMFPERCRPPYDDIVDFNNHTDTTQAELEAVFEKAAIRMDEVVLSDG